MGVLLTIGCYLVAFAPALALFLRFVAPDPLRIILFVLGAFLWLVSLLLSSIIWICISTLWASIPAALFVSIILQESAKVFYFWLLKKAQHGLNKMARGGPDVAPGVSDLHNARHMLALVCGLGMGVCAALFLTMNVFAEFSGAGTFGLPEALEKGTNLVNPAGVYLPLYYALSGLLLTLLHVTWTIMVWDSCHRIGSARASPWPLPAIVAVLSHFIVSALSSQNAYGYQSIVISAQFVILAVCILYSHIIMGGTLNSLGSGFLRTLSDWFTLAWIRSQLKRERAYVVEEMEATDRAIRT